MTSTFSIYLKEPRKHTDTEIKCWGNVATSIHSQIVCDVFRTKLRDSQKLNGLQSQKLSSMALYRKEGLIPAQLIRNKGLSHPPTILRIDPRTSCILDTVYSASFLLFCNGVSNFANKALGWQFSCLNLPCSCYCSPVL